MNFRTRGNIEGVSPLHRAHAGRFFTRPLDSDTTAIVGLLALPRSTAKEMMVMARINDQVYLDLASYRDPKQGMYRPSVLLECDAGSLLTTLEFRQFVLPDAAELFLRESHLPHRDTSLKWMVVVGATRANLRLEGPPGLYEIGAKALTFAGEAPGEFNGESISHLLRECLWGDGGRWGMATSMDPTFYDQWIVGERAANEKRDPQFAEFSRLMQAEVGPSPVVFTAETQQKRQEAIKRIVTEMLEEKNPRGADGQGVARERSRA